jgi:uncharacterized protein YcnI
MNWTETDTMDSPALTPVRRHRRAVRVLVTYMAAVTAVGVLAGAAHAHVTVQPGAVEGGGFAVVAFRVPNERDDASTTRVRVLFPEDQPIGSVRTTPMPGWSITTERRTLDEPIEMFGEQVSAVVSEVTWTAVGAGIASGQFVDFDVNLGPLPESGEMVFRALQVYSSGEQVNWNQVAVDDTVELEHPAPVLEITPPAADAADNPEETSSDDDAGEAVTSAPATDADPQGTGDSSASTALPTALSATALLVALAALFLAWRRRPS